MTQLQRAGAAEFAVIISDAWQKPGLGAELLRRLVSVARNEKLLRIVGEILPENRALQKIWEHLGFRLNYSPQDGVVGVELSLDRA